MELSEVHRSVSVVVHLSHGVFLNINRKNKLLGTVPLGLHGLDAFLLTRWHLTASPGLLPPLVSGKRLEGQCGPVGQCDRQGWAADVLLGCRDTLLLSQEAVGKLFEQN